VDLLDRLRLDVPVAQAGMGGGLAGPELVAAVAVAGGLGTLGLAPPAELREAIRQVRDAAPDRSVAVNLLMPFVRRSHVEACVESRIDVAVVAFGMNRSLMRWLAEHGVIVFVMVGTDKQASRAIACGADGLIAQGCEAGGHIAGDTPALAFLPRALKVAGGRPVLLAGGVAAVDDTRAAMAGGADGVVAGTRFLLTHEARAHPEYQRRILSTDKTFGRPCSDSRGPRRIAWCQRRDPAVVPRRRNHKARAPAHQRRQRCVGQASRLGDGAPHPHPDAEPADVLPRCPNDRDARVGGGPHGAVRG
jgi:nitronate monooxygenase